LLIDFVRPQGVAFLISFLHFSYINSKGMIMNKKQFFVAGITGNVGGAAADHLLSQGHAVTTLIRDLIL
jgi:hypothetical protein